MEMVELVPWFCNKGMISAFLKKLGMKFFGNRHR